MSTNGLSPPGEATYSSNTMFVGDGTWDSERNDFLLPNLQGLNFATMQYNGMGNRFRDLPQYHTLILGHGVLAAIVFIFMVPGAIFIARFWHSNSRIAFKLHVYIQILVVFLTTVILILGWFAVGPERSLTNPHHGIGVAIYVCILVQFLYGWLMYRGERKRTKPPIGLPLRVHLHKLFGRAVAILGFVQIALGLTLYGSPKALFILYALAGALILFFYLTLAYTNNNRILAAAAGGGRPPPSSYYATDYDGSYISGTETAPTQVTGRRKEESHWARNALGAVGLFGAYKWYQNRKDKKNQEKYDDQYTEQYDSRISGPTTQYDSRLTSRPPSRPGGPGGPPPPQGSYGPPSQYGPSSYAAPAAAGAAGAYMGGRPVSHGSRFSRRPSQSRLSTESWENIEDEKYNNQNKHTWRDRLLMAGAGVAAFEGVKSLFGRKKREDTYTGAGRYRPPMNRRNSLPSQTDVSRVEAGQAPFSPNDRRRPQSVAMDTLTPISPARPPPRRRPSVDSLDDYSEDESHVPPRMHGHNENHTLRDAIATFGLLAGYREWNKQRKERRIMEQAERIRQQEIDEEERYKRHSSGHYPLPEHTNTGRPSMSGTLLTGPDPALGSNPELSRHNFRPDTMQPPLPAAAGAVPLSPTVAPLPPQAGPILPQAGPILPQHNLVPQPQQPSVYSLPPPPPGPPPNVARPADYHAPPPGSLQMPQGAIDPDPSRLLAHGDPGQGPSHTAEAALAAGAIGAAAGAAAGHHRTQSQSPSRYNSRTRLGRPGDSMGSASLSQVNDNRMGNTQSPPVSVKVKMHNDGRHVTLRRLNEQEAAAEREARQRDRRNRRGSSLSSGGEDAGSRYRRNTVRPSSQQPITNVPVPPSMSGSALASSVRPNQSNVLLPGAGGPGRLPQASASPPVASTIGQPISPQPTHQGLSPGANPASSGAIASPGNIMSDVGTGTDVSAFDSNRRRRRAERARRDAAAAAKGNRVEFE